jgi:O-antigen ligase
MSKARRSSPSPARGVRAGARGPRPSAPRSGGVSAEGWGEALVWVLLLLPPVLLAVNAKESFRLPKLLASEWLGLASLLPLAFRLVKVEAVSWRELLRDRALAALPAVLPLLAVATAGLAASRHPLHLREALADLWIGAACLAGWSIGLSRPRLERLLAGLLAPATALALLGILQFHGIFQPFQFTGAASSGRLAITSLAGNPGDLGAYLALPCLLAQWALLREQGERRRGPVRAGLAAALVICLYALAVTQTLSALAAVALGSLVLWAFRAPRRILLTAASSGLALALVLVLAISPLRTRLVRKAGELAHGDWNSLLTGRLDGWRTALWMLREHPLAGVGQGAYRTEFVPAKLALMDRGVEFFPGQVDVNFENAHNDVLELGADLGVPGLLALGWGLWLLFGALRRLSRRTEEQRSAALAWAGTVALAILALFQFPFHVALVAFPSLLFLAWVFAAGAEPEDETAGGGGSVRGSTLGWLLVGLLAVALAWQGNRWHERLLGSTFLHQVEVVSISAASSGRGPANILPAHLELLRRAAELDPTEVAIPKAKGGQFLLFGNPRSAIVPYREALALEPQPETYLFLGRALLAAGETEEARRNFALALRLNPALAAQVPEGGR